MSNDDLTNFWLSWHAPDERAFELLSPWYHIADYHGGRVIAAAVKADSLETAKAMIYAAYTEHPGSLRFRGFQTMPEGWAPWAKPAGVGEDWTPGFPRADWMVW
jgi:hypothetical protein